MLTSSKVGTVLDGYDGHLSPFHASLAITTDCVGNSTDNMIFRFGCGFGSPLLDMTSTAEFVSREPCQQMQSQPRGRVLASNSFDLWFPYEFVNLERKTCRKAVSQHPFNKLSRVEEHILRGTLRGWNFCKSRAQEDVTHSLVNGVSADKVPCKLVVLSVGDDKFHLIVLREGHKVLKAKSVGRSPRTRTFDVDNLVDSVGDIAQRSLTACLDHQCVILSKQAVHQRKKLFGLQHGLAAGELNQRARSESFDLLLDFIQIKGFATQECVLRVTPSTAEVTASETNENAGSTSEGRFSLNGFIEFDQKHLEAPQLLASHLPHNECKDDEASRSCSH